MDDLEQFKKDMQDTHERLRGATEQYHKERNSAKYDIFFNK